MEWEKVVVLDKKVANIQPMTLHDAAIKAIKARAAKCEVHPDIQAKFLALCEESTFPRAVNGNSSRWARNGCVAYCTKTVNGTLYTYEMTVVNIWEGYKLTILSRIEESILAPNCSPAFSTIARAEEVRSLKPGVSQ